MSKPREAQQWEKEYIRTEFEQIVKKNPTPAKVDELRRTLAELLNLSYPQVKAIGAWKRKPDQEKLILEPTEVCNPKAKPDNGQTHSSPNNEVPPVVSEQKADEVSSIPAQAAVDENTDEKRPTITFHPKSGAWTEFENSTIKEKWRQAEMAFLDKNGHLLAKKPEDWVVLCTPGIKCHLEIQHLLRRGVRPSNIIAIEREKGAWSEFERNCAELGIQPRFGDLKEVLPSMRNKVDVALLDFLGQYCLSYQEIVYQLPMADKGMIAINIAGKRERKDIQRTMQDLIDGELPFELIQKKLDESLRNQQLIVDGGSKPMTQNERGENFYALWGKANNDVHEERRGRDVEVTDEHRDAQLDALVHQVGMARPDCWVYPNVIGNFPQVIQQTTQQDIRREGFDPNFLLAKSLDLCLQKYEQAVAPFRMALDGQSQKLPWPQNQQCRIVRENLEPLVDLAWKAAVGAVKCLASGKFRYLSRVGQIPSPYLTDLAIIERPRNDYRQLQRTTLFVTEIAKRFAEDHLKGKKGKYPLGMQGERITMEVMEGNNLKRVASISLDSLLEEVRRYRELEERYPLSNGGKSVERTNIEE